MADCKKIDIKRTHEICDAFVMFFFCSFVKGFMKKDGFLSQKSL
jgi:hypothetical protein